MIPTTAVFAEILFIGLEAAVWLVLLLLAIFGTPNFDMTLLDGWETPTAFLVGVAAYGFGVVIDRTADTTYAAVRDSPWGQRYMVGWFGKCPDFCERPARPGVMRMFVMGLEDGRSRFIEYQRSRLRIARATAFNLFLLLLFGGWYLAVRAEVGPFQLASFGGVTLAMFVMSVWTAERIGDAFMDRLVEVYELARKPSERAHEPVADDECDGEHDGIDADSEEERAGKAAAVCYRERGSGIEFLLVTTSGNVKRWTFPKGTIEVNQDGPRAAECEAKQEAGARGDVERNALITYEYPSGKKEKKRKSVAVEAYLLHVRTLRKQDKKERGRRRGWFSPDKAKLKLGCARPKRFQREHERVIDEAVKVIENRARRVDSA